MKNIIEVEESGYDVVYEKQYFRSQRAAYECGVWVGMVVCAFIFVFVLVAVIAVNR